MRTNSYFRIISALAVFSLIALAGMAADNDRVSYRGQQYSRVDSGWLLHQGDETFVVDAATISVRFVPGVDYVGTFRELLLGSGGEAELAQLPLVRINKLGIHDLGLMSTQDPLDIARRMEATGMVLYAEPTTIGRWVALPSDTRFNEQYHLRNTGQSGGTVDADMDVDEAWDIESGNSSIAVGVLDSGTDIDHVDLLDNLWKNSGETPGNNQDDDGNGFVDDYDGWNFEANNGNPRSTNSHGTQVAGIVAARTDNGTGVSGVAGGFGASPGAAVMPVKVGTSGPNGSILDDAIIYAADNGAKIITMSLTVGSSAAINDALDYAYNTKGVFIDCASGNSGGGSVSYPANNVNVMAVGATDRNDNRASYSQYGSQLEVVAPGSNILSTTLNNGYTSGSGTSFAAPNVAGTAALILSRNGSVSNATVRSTIQDTCDDVGAVGQDLLTGHGRVNARAALEATPPSTCMDLDGDGFFPQSGCGTAIDCDDSDSSVYPGAPEVCNDGIDQDCDGVDKLKGKGCGGGGGGDAKEQCKNGVDDDGDGAIDCADSDCSTKKFCQ
jgi:subtilisin family serine protease